MKERALLQFHLHRTHPQRPAEAQVGIRTRLPPRQRSVRRRLAADDGRAALERECRERLRAPCAHPRHSAPCPRAASRRRPQAAAAHPAKGSEVVRGASRPASACGRRLAGQPRHRGKQCLVIGARVERLLPDVARLTLIADSSTAPRRNAPRFRVSRLLRHALLEHGQRLLAPCPGGTAPSPDCPGWQGCPVTPTMLAHELLGARQPH